MAKCHVTKTCKMKTNTEYQWPYNGSKLIPKDKLKPFLQRNNTSGLIYDLEILFNRLKNDKKTEFFIACREIEKKALITLEKIL